MRNGWDQASMSCMSLEEQHFLRGVKKFPQLRTPFGLPEAIQQGRTCLLRPRVPRDRDADCSVA